MLPLCVLFLPESLGSIVRRFKGERRLELVNRSLRRLGHPPLQVIAEPDEPAKLRLSELFQHRMAEPTLLLTGAYFLHMVSFYFFLKWVPKIVADLGFTAAEAGMALVVANIGGLIGSVLFSVLTWRMRVSPLLAGALLATFLFLALFGQVGADLALIYGAAAAAGFFTNAGVVGLYGLIAEVYPDRLRASGAGFSLGMGRAGAALGPIAAGLLFAQSYSLSAVAAALGAGSLLAALAVLRLRVVIRRSPGRAGATASPG
jgi:predicted MFS family arabinose efflux permease